MNSKTHYLIIADEQGGEYYYRTGSSIERLRKDNTEGEKFLDEAHSGSFPTDKIDDAKTILEEACELRGLEQIAKLNELNDL